MTHPYLESGGLEGTSLDHTDGTLLEGSCIPVP